MKGTRRSSRWLDEYRRALEERLFRRAGSLFEFQRSRDIQSLIRSSAYLRALFELDPQKATAKAIQGLRRDPLRDDPAVLAPEERNALLLLRPRLKKLRWVVGPSDLALRECVDQHIRALSARQLRAKIRSTEIKVIKSTPTPNELMLDIFKFYFDAILDHNLSSNLNQKLSFTFLFVWMSIWMRLARLPELVVPDKPNPVNFRKNETRLLNAAEDISFIIGRCRAIAIISGYGCDGGIAWE